VSEESIPPFSRHKEFQYLKAGRFRWLVHRSELDDTLRKLLENPDRHLPDLWNVPLGERPSTSIAHVSGFFLKRFNRASPTKMLKSVFRIAPSLRAFRMAWHLEGLGIPTARALAVTNKRFARVLLRGYLVTEVLHEAKTLEQWGGNRIQAARSVSALVARLHGAGFVHRDLNSTNVLFNQFHEPCVVDLDTMRYIRQVPAHLALDDLARFSRKALLCPKISRADRARFLKEYCRLRRMPDWRSAWNRIEQLNRVEYARLARKSDRKQQRQVVR